MTNVGVSDSQISVLDGKMTINIEDVVSHLYFGEMDIVLLGGSLIDGFGSCTSDLDIYVISDVSASTTDFPANRHHRHVARDGKLISVTDYMTSTGMILDTQYRTKDQIRALLASTRNAYADAAGRTKMLINNMQEADHKTVYRLYSAIVLQGKADFEELMKSGLSQDQFCYLLFRNIAGHYPLLNDVAGAWRDGDLVEGCERARLFVSKIAYALTHMFGNTNAEMKWIYRALQALPQKYASLVDRYFEISLRGVRESHEMKQLILDCLDLADDFF